MFSSKTVITARASIRNQKPETFSLNTVTETNPAPTIAVQLLKLNTEKPCPARSDLR